MRTEELICEAERLEEAGLAPEAMKLWREVLARGPDPVALCRLGSLEMDIGDWSDAEQHFLSAVSLSPELHIAYEFLGILYLEQGNLVASEHNLRKSLELEETPSRFTLLGVTQLRRGLTREARRSFNDAIGLDPDYAEAYYNLGVTFREERRLEAARLFQKAIEINPDYGRSHRELGWMLRLMHKYRDAEHHIRRAIELDDSDGWAYIYLGNILWGEHNLPSAERAFLKATEVWPDECTAFWCIANFYEHTGRSREADLCYEKAIQLDPDDPTANIRFGLYLKDAGEITKAKIYLERAVVLDPEDKRAETALAELDWSKPEGPTQG